MRSSVFTAAVLAGGLIGAAAPVFGQTLIVGNDEKGQGGEPFEAPTYACRPPGVHHGPFKSERGCVLYEIHYYDETKNPK